MECRCSRQSIYLASGACFHRRPQTARFELLIYNRALQCHFPHLTLHSPSLWQAKTTLLHMHLSRLLNPTADTRPTNQPVVPQSPPQTEVRLVGMRSTKEDRLSCAACKSPRSLNEAQILDGTRPTLVSLRCLWPCWAAPAARYGASGMAPSSPVLPPDHVTLDMRRGADPLPNSSRRAFPPPGPPIRSLQIRKARIRFIANQHKIYPGHGCRQWSPTANSGAQESAGSPLRTNTARRCLASASTTSFGSEPISRTRPEAHPDEGEGPMTILFHIERAGMFKDVIYTNCPHRTITRFNLASALAQGFIALGNRGPGQPYKPLVLVSLEYDKSLGHWVALARSA
ncbi:hypothetical protein B0H12DRAFT_231283 [Mycena haematopus]|nr:hypothetical protein B0H12DRAFT_231283 [Mycena haematopus]